MVTGLRLIALGILVLVLAHTYWSWWGMIPLAGIVVLLDWWWRDYDDERVARRGGPV